MSSIREWPQWLLPAHLEVPDSLHLRKKVVNLNAIVKKKRPLIYVYDLPPDFNSLLLEVIMNLIFLFCFFVLFYFLFLPAKSKSVVYLIR